jgi:hypothetical protein
MASNKSKQPKAAKNDYEAIGPAESGFSGYGADGANPVNPSDAIFMGRPMTTVMPSATVTSRPFREATRSPLHYNDGPGTDENVTSRRPPLYGLLGNSHSDLDHEEVLPIQGVDHQPYSHGSNVSTTLNGADIYGT